MKRKNKVKSKRKTVILKTARKKLLPGDKSRNAIGVRLLGVVSDLSKTRHDMGEKIQQQSEELKKKNKQLKNGLVKHAGSLEKIHMCTIAMESTSDGIFIIDTQKSDFPVIYSNQAFYSMTGYAKGNIIGQNYFSLYGDEANNSIISEIKHAIFMGKGFHGEMLNFRKNGKKYWDLLRLTPVHGTRGTVTHYVGIQTDITKMREKELEIDEQREELLHVTRVGKLAEFVSSLAHEISQPLTSILAYAQAAQRMLADRDPELKKVLSYIVDDNQRATQIVNRLRSLLKKTKPESKPIDINTVIKETMVLIATDATVRNILLKLDIKSGLPNVYGDRIQIQQVVLNLISNSFDAIGSSGKSPRQISITTSLKDTKTILVEVKDSGSGISAENMPKIFTHFFTSKPDGLGMGLSISRSIVEAHGGRLYVENNPDRGVTFFFTLPVKLKDA